MTKVNVSIDTRAWRLFRIACLRRGVSASSVIDRLVQAQLTAWAQAGDDLPDDVGLPAEAVAHE